MITLDYQRLSKIINSTIYIIITNVSINSNNYGPDFYVNLYSSIIHLE